MNNKIILRKLIASAMLFLITYTTIGPLLNHIDLDASDIQATKNVTVDMADIDWDSLEVGDTVSTYPTTIDLWSHFEITTDPNGISQEGITYNPANNSYIVDGNSTPSNSTYMYLFPKLTIDTSVPYLFSLGFDARSQGDVIGVFTSESSELSSQPGYGTGESYLYSNVPNNQNDLNHKLRLGSTLGQTRVGNGMDFNTVEFNIDPSKDFVELQSCLSSNIGDACEESTSSNMFPDLGQAGDENDPFDPVTADELDNPYAGIGVRAGTEDKELFTRSLYAKFKGINEIQTDFDNITVEQGTSVEEIHDYLNPVYNEISDYNVTSVYEPVSDSNLDDGGYDPDGVGNHYLFTYTKTSLDGKNETFTSVDVYIRDPEVDAQLNVSSDTVLQSDAPKTEKELMQEMDVSAVEPDGQDISSNIDVISVADYDGYDFNDPKPGTYQITYYVIGSSNEAIYNHKTGLLTVVEDDASTVVDANNFTMNYSDVTNLDEDMAIKLSGASAKIINGDEVGVTISDSQLDAIINAKGDETDPFPLTFYADNSATGEGSSKTIYVKIIIANEDEYQIESVGNYNVILSEDLEAEMADSEGAIAVKGDVNAPTIDGMSYSIAAANESYSYGQHVGLPYTKEQGPAILLGGTLTNPSQNSKVVVLGNSLISEGTTSQFQSQINRDEYVYDINEKPQQEIYDIIDGFFDEADGYIDVVQEYEEGDVFANSGSSQWADVTDFTFNKVDNVGGMAIADIDGTDIDISEYNITSEVLSQNAIIYYSDATTVNFNVGATTLDGQIIDTNALYNDNIIDTEADYSKGNLMEELAAKSIWVFPNATEINVNQYGVIGTVLAPNADIIGDGGAINGQIIAKNLTQINGFEAHNFTFKVELNGNVSIHKSNQDGADMSGVEFGIYDEDDTLIQTVITNEVGYAEFTKLPFGDYTIKEISAPAGYNLLEEDIDVNISPLMEDLTYELTDTYSKGVLSLRKVDSGTNEELKGAEFTIYDENDVCVKVDVTDDEGNTTEECYSQTSDSDGYLEFRDLDYGTYYVKETETPKGYVTDDTKYYFEVDENSYQTIHKMTNTKYGSFELYKLDKETSLPLEGVEFTVYDENHDEVVTLTTDENGYISYDRLPYGFYEIVETKSIDGYDISDHAWSTYFVIAEAKLDYTWTVSNVQTIGQFSIHKVDASDKSINLEGVTFDVYDSEGNFVETLTTDSEGNATSSVLDYGTYTLEETSTLEGYILSDDIITITLNEDTDKETYELLNDEAPIVIDGSVSIHKTDYDTNEDLAGVTFGLYSSDDTLIEEKTTDSNGYLEFTGLDVEGEYYIKENSTISGYALNSDIIDFTVSETSQDFEYEITNEKNVAGFKVLKSDSDTKEVLSGAEFKLYDLDDNEIATVTTDSLGIASFENITYGTYKLVETIAPEGYVADPQTYYVTIDRDNQEFTFDFANNDNRIADRVIEIQKVDMLTGEGLEGAEFDLLDSEGNVVDTLVTDENGYAQSKVLDVDFTDEVEDVFTIRETKAPEGYEGSEFDTQIILDSDKPNYSIEIQNSQKLGKATIHKVDEDTDEPLENTEFRLYKDVTLDENGDVIVDEDGNFDVSSGTEVSFDNNLTDEEGNILFDELPFGEYVLIETDATEGYTIHPQAYVFTINENIQEMSFTIKDNKEKAFLQILKVDENDNSVRLEGAVYDIFEDTNGNGTYDEGTDLLVLADQVTGQTGAISVELPLGSYFVIEKSIDVQSQQKYDEDGELVFDTDGEPVMEDVVYEVDSTPSYVIDIEGNNEIYTYTQEDKKETITANISLDKTAVVADLDNEGEYLENNLEGAEFCIYYENPELVQGITPIDCQTTDENGYLIFTDLEIQDQGEYNSSYFIKEVSAPYGYYVSKEVREVKLTRDDANSTINVDYIDYEITLDTTLTKIDSESLDFLTGAKFDIYQDTNDNGVLDNDGSDLVVYSDQEVDENGQLVISFNSQIPFINQDGESIMYFVKETQAPEGYYINDSYVTLSYAIDRDGNLIINPDEDYVSSDSVSVPEFELDEDNFGVPNALEDSFDFENEIILANINLNKYDFDSVVDEDYINATPLSDATYCLYSVEDDESLTELECNVTDENGAITFENYPVGDYVIKETISKDGYFIDANSYDVTLDGTTYDLDNPYILNVTDKEYDADITIVKRDSAEPYDVLEGATFDIYQDTDGDKELDESEDTLVESGLVSDENGEINFSFDSQFKMIDENGDSIGYLVKETQAPQGYLLNDEVTYFAYVIDDSGKLVLNTDGSLTFGSNLENPSETLTDEIDFNNDLALNDITLHKTDQYAQDLEGAVFCLYDSEGTQVGECETTDANGNLTFSNLPIGTYTVKEQSTITGHFIDDTEYEIELTTQMAENNEDPANEKQPETIESVNEAFDAQITFVKEDEVSGQVLADAEFSIYQDTDANGIYDNSVDSEIATGLVSDENGEITFSYDESNKMVDENGDSIGYFLVETKAPEGYYLSEDALYFAYTVDENGDLVSNTDNSVVIGENISLPTQMLTDSVSFDNEEVLKSVTITKTDENLNLLDGVTYSIYTQDPSQEPSATAIDSQITVDGTLSFDNLKVGTYYIKETDALAGYYIDDTVYSVTIDDTKDQQDLSFELTNSLYNADIVITKLGEDIYGLKDAEFEVYMDVNDNGTIETDVDSLVVENLTTDGSGEAVFNFDENHPMVNADGSENTFLIRETNAPDNYLLDSTVYAYTFNFVDDGAGNISIIANPSESDNIASNITKPSENLVYDNIEIRNELIQASIKLTKTDLESNLLAGVEYCLYDVDPSTDDEAEAIKCLTTDSNGELTFEDLLIGTYYVQESNTIPGYYISQEVFSVEVTEEDNDKVFTLDATNESYSADVSIVKTQDTDSNNKLEGAEFDIYRDINENATYESDIDEVAFTGLVTDSNGEVTFTFDKDNPFMDSEGNLYQFIIRETKAPEGYLLNSNDTIVTFGLDKDGNLIINPSSDELGVNIVKPTNPVNEDVEITNEKAINAITITKTDEQTNEPLTGVEYCLYDVDPSIDSNASAISCELTELNTEGNALATFNGLEVGTYYVQENQSLYGYYLDNNVYEVELTTDTVDTPVNIDATNELITASIDITKVDLVDNSILLSGAEFDIYKDSDSDGVFNSENDELIESGLVTDENGQIQFNYDETNKLVDSNGLSVGYFIVETKAPDAYLLDANAIYFAYTVDSEGNLVAVENSDVSSTTISNNIINSGELSSDINITNEKAINSISLTKYDDLGEVLPGATFCLYDQDPSTNSDLTPITDCVESDSSGIVNFNDLEVGTYYVQEQTPPFGYYLDETVYTFDLTNENSDEIQTGESINNIFRGEVEITKVDSKDSSIVLEGAEFDIYLDNGDNSEVIDANDTLVDTITTDSSGIATFSFDENNLMIDSEGNTIGYIAVETSAPEGYLLPENNETYFAYTIDKDNNLILSDTQEDIITTEDYSNIPTTSLEIANEQALSDISIIKTDQYNNNVVGATFCLYNEDPSINNSAVAITCQDTLIDSNDISSVTFTDLTVGTYYVQEQSTLNGYYIDPEVYTFEVSVSQVESNTILEETSVNEQFEGEVVFTKVDENSEILQGAEFSLTQDSDFDGKISFGDEVVFENLQTDSNGQITFDFDDDFKMVAEDGSLITYFLEETKAPSGYEQIAEPIAYTFMVDSSGNLVVNPESTSDIATDLEKPNSDLSVNVDIENTLIENDLTLVKTNDYGELVSGATYCIYDISPSDANATELDCETTNEDGTLQFEDLVVGTYYVMESDAPSGYYIDESIYEVVSDEGEMDELEVSDKIHNANITLTKVDSTDSSILLEGAEFSIIQDTNANGTLDETDKIVDEGLQTNSSGELEFTFNEEFRMLNDDATPIGYFVTETKAPTGYVLDTEAKLYTFILDSNGEVVVNPSQGSHSAQNLPYFENKEANIEIENDMMYSSLELTKKSLDGKLLEGATYCMYDSEPVEGNEIECATTGSTGSLQFSEYPAGTYYVMESEAPMGYTVDETVHEFNLPMDNDGTQNNTMDQADVVDSKLTANISVVKMDEDTKELLEGAEFSIYQDVDEDKVLTESDTEVMSNITTDENGEFNFVLGEDLEMVDSDGIAIGYFLKETKAPQNYELEDTEMYLAFNIDEDGNLVMDADSDMHFNSTIKESEEFNETIEVYNKEMTSNVSLLKRDQFDNPLEGVEFCVFNEDPTNNPDAELIKCIESKEDGLAVFESLSLGTYYIQETRTVYGHFLSENVIELTLDEDNYKNPGVIEYVNRLYDPEITVVKVDSVTGEVLEGAVFNVYQDTNGNKVLDDGDLSMVENLVTGSDGKVSFVFNDEFRMVDENGQAIGYIIKEMDAPEGYVINEDEIYVTFSIDENAQIIFNPDENYVAPLYIVDPSKELAFTFTFENDPIDSSTGTDNGETTITEGEDSTEETITSTGLTYNIYILLVLSIVILAILKIRKTI